jgi:glycosyltransferase involved in cell wall biosynthesis
MDFERTNAVRPAERPARLRVAAVYRYFNRSGSIPTLFLENAERLAEDEDVTLFCSTKRREPTGVQLSFETVEPLVRGCDRLRYAIECATFARRASQAIARGRSRFDVIHVEGFAAWYADLVTVHAVRPAELEDYFSHVEPKASFLRRRLNANLLRPQTGVVMRIEERLLGAKPPPYCLCPSQRVKDDLQRWYGVPGDRIEVLPYGIDLHRFDDRDERRARVRAEHGIDDDGLVVLFVGDDFQRKGLDRAIRGVARSTSGADLWVVGGRRPAIEKGRGLAGSAGIGGRTTFHGRVSVDRLTDLYCGADVLLLPTRQDSWALPVVEGLAAGVVVVASEHAGSSEIIEPGVDGFVLDGQGTAEEIASYLDGPLSDAGLRAEVSARARASARRFDRKQLYQRYREAHHIAYELAREPAPSRAVTAPATEVGVPFSENYANG